MKHHGSKFEYEDERDNDLMRAYRLEISQCGFIRVTDVFRKIVAQPSARFWVSEERAAIVISAMMRGDDLSNMRPLKKEMFQEIYRRVMLEKQQHPDWSTYQLVFSVVRQQAPKFYLTPGSAKVIISRIKRKRRNGR